jgi:hypothetical protein
MGGSFFQGNVERLQVSYADGTSAATVDALATGTVTYAPVR